MHAGSQADLLIIPPDLLPFLNYEFPAKNQIYQTTPYALVFESRTLCKHHDFTLRKVKTACLLPGSR